MKVINLHHRNNHAEQVSDVEKYIGNSKAKLNQIISEITNSKNPEAHKAEFMIFKRLSELGLYFAKVLFCKPHSGGLFWKNS